MKKEEQDFKATFQKFLCHVLKALIFTKTNLKLGYFCKKKKAKSSIANISAPRPLVSGGIDSASKPTIQPQPLQISGYVPACAILNAW